MTLEEWATLTAHTPAGPSPEASDL